MSLTSIAFLTWYSAFFIAAFFFPAAGVWGYLLEWYNHPPFHWWGKEINWLLGGRWSFYMGLAMGAGLLLHYRKFTTIPFTSHLQTKFVILYTANAFVVSLWAYTPDESWGVAFEHLKMLVVYWVIVKTHSREKFLEVLLLISMVGVIIWGWEATFESFRGRSLNLGGPGTYGENFVAPHVVAFLPLIAWCALREKGWIRWMFLLGAPLVVNVVAASQSRGAFLALVVAAVATLIFSRRKMRKWAQLGTVLGIIVVLALFNEQLWERLQTIGEYETDTSATGRIEAWSAATKLARRNPLGYGGEAFDSGLGAPLMPKQFRTTHNMFFEILVAWGVQGVFFFFGFILITMRDCLRIYRSTWDGISWPPSRESVIALSILAGLFSMLMASIFLNRYRWELWWIFGAVIVCLNNRLSFRAQQQSSSMNGEEKIT